MNCINICLACDNNYAQYAGVVIASVLANAAEDDLLSIYILDGGIAEDNRQKLLSLKNIRDCNIVFVKIDESLFDEYKQVKTHEYITLATYYRLKLSNLLPDVNRVIYMDCDMVVNSSLHELFATEMKDAPLAGVTDLNHRRVRKNPTYINAGMLVMDLDNIRKFNIEDEFLKWTIANKNTITCGDQEIINEVCKGRIKIVDECWNVQSSNFVNRSSYTKHPRIIHFVAARKPWHWASFSVHKDLYFKNLQITPWALNSDELYHWTVENRRAARWAYLKYRPLFWLRPRFYYALYRTFLKK